MQLDRTRALTGTSFRTPRYEVVLKRALAAIKKVLSKASCARYTALDEEKRDQLHLAVYDKLFGDVVRKLQCGGSARDVEDRTFQLGYIRRFLETVLDKTDWEEAFKKAVKLREEFDKLANPKKYEWYNAVLETFKKFREAARVTPYSEEMAWQLESTMSPLFGHFWGRVKNG
jgi:hypothetical protein